MNATSETADFVNFVRGVRLVHGYGCVPKRVSRAYRASLTAVKGWLSGEHRPARLDMRLAQLRVEIEQHQTELAEVRDYIDRRLGTPAWRKGSGSRPVECSI